MINGERLYYLDDTYAEDEVTVIDLENFQDKLSEVMSGCLNRGGNFNDFDDSTPETFAKT